MDAILAHCRALQDLGWLAEIALALACTGLRISELAGLRWADVDWANNLILLTDESTRLVRPGGRTARAIRSFPIDADLGRVLEGRPRSSDGLVFHGPRGGLIKPDTVRNILVREVLAALAARFPSPAGEVGFVNGRLHSFRHYFCSVCANSGVPEQVVMQWLGHRQSAMVRHYYHLHNEEAQRQMQRLKFVEGADGANAGSQFGSS